jgi:adenylate kinase family enzyme
MVFDVNEEELVQRIILRGETSGRSDDTAESIKVRLEVYKEDTEPLIDFYKEFNDVVTINALGDIEEIYKTIEANFS